MPESPEQSREAQIRTIRWRRLDLPGEDVATVARVEAGWQLAGATTFTLGGETCRLEYRVACDDTWRTRRCKVRGVSGEDPISIDIAHDGEGRWTLGGEPVASIDGCEDVDLAFTPATNLLPVRRLALPVGASSPWTRRAGPRYGRRR